MPTDTFFNLPEAKREKIIDAAIDEFAEHPFNQASVARIVEQAGIPRGSFYQYFDDLKDLYRYIFHLSGQKKVAYLQQHMTDHDRDIFQQIRDLYIAGLKFADEHPRLARIGSRFMKEDDDLKQEIMGELEQKSDDFFGVLLSQAQQRGEIDARVEVKTASFMFFTLNFAITDHLLAQSDPNGDTLVDNEAFMKMVDQMLYILKNGMAAK
ncbi:MAG: TetR/AcrR family transcriptional regulator [Bacillaceae bacterium]|nr:TetR/AcrR family transcriptional regulator [Bacillaceae bacterium]